MSETARIWMEVVFDIGYLIAIWWLVIQMRRRLPQVREEDQSTAHLVMMAFILLALGDTGHVGFRVVAYALGGAEPVSFTFAGSTFSLLGLGTVMTAITVTLFYVLMVAIWRVRYRKAYGPFEVMLFAAALIRLLFLAVPANEWNSPVPPQPWSIIRNIPLLIQGLGVAYLFLRDSRANDDRPFWWMGIMILLSYACYTAVVLFVRQIPLIGLLMIPKTVAYLVMAVLAYREIW